MATKFFELKYACGGQQRIHQIQNPGSAFASTDVNKLVGLSSGYVSLLSTASTSIALFTYEQFGILRAIPDGVCTAKSTQRCVFVPVQTGDVLCALMSSDASTSGTPAASPRVTRSNPG